MYGLGKTTLVKEVDHDVEGFDRVVVVIVSETPNITRIQMKIFLIILNNLWNQWGDKDLKNIGIPLVETDKGSKAILTTREQKVCKHIRSEHMVQLNVMDDDKAWNLFNMNANLDNFSSEIIEVAMEVGKECGGLPLAILPLARVLRGKTLNGWKLAYHKISSSRLMHIEDVPKQRKEMHT
ncbi:hypothetical protein Goari_010067 [Gossypium aridum]|uniref:NB-ARC domain-containing protein n=1 Tax=Gossypium aridum TaxID=34290 RepID=A0A7J8XYY4_GOSAI|nr:hypothetical protein [Gossypium aridum]